MAQPPDLPPFLQDALAKSREISESVQQWRERNGRQLERANEVVRDYQRRFGGWIERNGPQIETVLKALIQFNQEGDRVAREWKDAGLAYLVTPLNLAEKLMISMHAGPGNEEELLDFLEATLADEAFVGSVTALLDEATMLSDVARAHLEHGFAHLSDRESFEAWPPLIIGLEGAFADVAVEYGIAVREGNDIFLIDKKSGRPRRSPSVEKVAVELGHSADATEFGEFLIRQVYGGPEIRFVTGPPGRGSTSTRSPWPSL